MAWPLRRPWVPHNTEVRVGLPAASLAHGFTIRWPPASKTQNGRTSSYAARFERGVAGGIGQLLVVGQWAHYGCVPSIEPLRRCARRSVGRRHSPGIYRSNDGHENDCGGSLLQRGGSTRSASFSTLRRDQSRRGDFVCRRRKQRRNAIGSCGPMF